MPVGRRITASVVALGLIQVNGGACAMGQPGVTTSNCRILGAEKLPAEIGGAKLLCDAIDAAAREHAPRAPFTVEVRVLSPSMLAAVVTLKDGRKLPEQKIAVSDSALKRRSLERFADAIALQVAGAVGS